MKTSKNPIFEQEEKKRCRLYDAFEKHLTRLTWQLIKRQVFRDLLVILTIFLALTARIAMSKAAQEDIKEVILPKNNSSVKITLTNYSSDFDTDPRFFVFSGHKLLVNKITQTPVITSLDLLNRTVKFFFKEIEYNVAELSEDSKLSSNVELVDFIKLYLTLPEEIIGPARKGHQLLEWDALHKFCGKCGSSTISSITLEESFKLCSSKVCGQKYYPKIQPVVVVGVERGDELLLARGWSFPSKIYTTVAGFVEPGETLEEAVKREVTEETGIHISDLEYVGSQSWQSPTQIIVGFRARYASGELAIDKKELEHAAFFHAESLPPTFPGENLTISQRIISSFHKRYLEQKYK